VRMLHFAGAPFSMTGVKISFQAQRGIYTAIAHGAHGLPHPLVPLLRKERDVSASPKQGEVNPACMLHWSRFSLD
jgi:hypothetical protein